MSKKIIIFISVALLIVLMGFVVKGVQKDVMVSPSEKTELLTEAQEHAVDKTTPTQAKLVLFYSNRCPHCQIVETFIEKNDITNKIELEQKEVSTNADNAQLLFEAAKICHIAQNQIGVPMLFDGSICLSGDQPVIDYLTQKIDE